MMKQTALENVCLPLTYAGIQSESERRLPRALKRVGLEDRMDINRHSCQVDSVSSSCARAISIIKNFACG